MAWVEVTINAQVSWLLKDINKTPASRDLGASMRSEADARLHLDLPGQQALWQFNSTIRCRGSMPRVTLKHHDLGLHSSASITNDPSCTAAHLAVHGWHIHQASAGHSLSCSSNVAGLAVVVQLVDGVALVGKGGGRLLLIAVPAHLQPTG